MRYFAELSYRGTHYFGWQKQPKQISVQETLEQAFSTILGTPIEVTGCGRTDTGVHAKQYFLHFDFDGNFPEAFTRRINKFLPPDIAIQRIIEVSADAHARYDAYHRKYEYHIDLKKNPFGNHLSYHFPFADQLDLEKLQAAAQLLLRYEEFYPFCKSNTDVKTMQCELKEAHWEHRPAQQKLVLHVAANRFLRGMIRLIVGMCLNVGTGKIALETVKEALDNQTRLQKSWSVPPDGLYLMDIRYPYL
jgi:tRNA pseudouridine38-40 synthase